MIKKRILYLKKILLGTFQNQQGVSLPVVISAFGLVSVATYTIFHLSKMGQQQAAVVRKISYTELERKRISTILADSKNCEANFLNQSPGGTAYAGGKTYTQLVTSAGAVFATNNSAGKANQYYKVGGAGSSTRGVLTLNDIRTTWNGTNSNGGSLVITYLDSTAGNEQLAFTGSKYARITIPMYFNVVGGVIKNCYAISENSKVSEAISNACTTTAPNSVVYNNKTGAILNSCVTNIDFQSSATNSTDCSAIAGTYLNGVDIVDKTSANDTGYSMQIKSDKCKGLSSTITADTKCAAGKSSYAITSGSIQCDFAGGSVKETPECGAGQLLVKTSSTTSTCLTVDCSTSGTYYFVNKISGSSFSCVTAPASTCAANQFAKGFDAAGNAICADMPAMNGSCSSGRYGTSVSRDTATYNGSLNCSTYSKAKSCPTPSNTTFVTSFSAVGAANCQGY